MSKASLYADPPPNRPEKHQVLAIFAIKDNSKTIPNTWNETILVSGHSVSFKIDTGSDVNLISHEILKKIKPKPKLVPSAVKLTSYTGHLISTLGSTEMKCAKNGKELIIKFFVTNLSAEHVLGIHACLDLGLVTKVLTPVEVHSVEKLFKLYADVFGPPEMLRCKPYHINLLANAKPFPQAACRKIPPALKLKLELEVHKMMERGIIERADADDAIVTWTHPAIIITINEPLRLCLDCRQLNKYILADHYPVPHFEEALANTKGSQYFTLLTAPDGFTQLPLDEASSNICVMMTPCGKYKFQTIPYGLLRAPVIFQAVATQIFNDIDGVVVHVDEVLVHGKTKDEHNARLTHLLERARKCNLKFGLVKVQLAKQVNFMGFSLSGNGIVMDQTKVEAVKALAVPLNKQEVQRFVSVCTSLSLNCQPLEKLLNKSEKFVWGKEQDMAFNTLKNLLCEMPALRTYVPNKTFYIMVAACSYGLGAAAFQEGHPLGFYSTPLDGVQQKYLQIEKKLQAVLFGLESFRVYTHGKEIVVKSNHKLLLSVIKEPLDMMTSPRLQAIIFELMKFHFKLEYVAGKDLAVAYALSRSPLNHSKLIQYPEPSPHTLLLCASEARISDFKRSLREDPVLQHVISYIREGWPKYPSCIKSDAKKYFNIKEHLLYAGELLFCENKLVVPEKQRRNILQQLHTGHQNARTCLQRAQPIYYWPTMDNDVELFVASCSECLKTSELSSANNVVGCLEMPELPWNKLGIDIVQVRRRDFAFIVDYFSRFLTIKPVNVKTAKALIAIVEDVLSVHGLPMEIASPNAPPFNTAAWKLFLKTHDIKHTQGEDDVMESHAEIAKTLIMKKSIELFLAVLEYNSTPTSNLLPPSELLMGRRLRTNLLVPRAMLVPNYDVSKAVTSIKRDQEIQNKKGLVLKKP